MHCFHALHCPYIWHYPHTTHVQEPVHRGDGQFAMRLGDEDTDFDAFMQAEP